MVLWTSVIFSLISAVLSIIVPVVAAIWFCRRQQAPFSTVLVGALTFFVMQVLLRIPLLLVVNHFFSIELETTKGLLLYSAFLAITAALFEEFGRLGAFKIFRLKGDWKNAVAMGIGHGGIESILLVGINVAANTILLALLAMDLPIGLPPEVVQPLLDTAPYMFLLAGIERILTLPIHIALSILVVAGVARKNYGYVALAIAAHFLLNFPLGWMGQNWGVLSTELYILLCSVVAWLFIFRSRALFKESDS